jgi:hypothetical protein
MRVYVVLKSGVLQNEEEIMGIYKKPKDALDAADELKEKQKGDYYHFHVNPGRVTLRVRGKGFG